MKLATPALILLLLSFPLLGEKKETGFMITQHHSNNMEGAFGQQSSTMLIEIRGKGDQIRFDFYMGGIKGGPFDTSTIYNATTGNRITIMHGQGSYVSVSLEEQEKGKTEMLEYMGQMGALKVPDEQPELKKTGRADSIDGVDVEEYTAVGAFGEMRYWFTSVDAYAELVPALMQMNSMPGSSLGSLNFPDPATYPGFPLRVEMTMQTNTARMSVTTHVEIESKVAFSHPIDDSIFRAPDGYKQVKSLGYPMPQ